MIKASYFDHRQSQLQSIYLDLQEQDFGVLANGKRYKLNKKRLKLEERFEHAPCILNFPDGSHCEIHDEADQLALLAYLDYQPSLVQRWQKKWKWALLAIIMMGVMLGAAREWGVPVVADKIASRLPLSYERALGADIMKLLDKGMLRPSKLSYAKIAQIEEIVNRLQTEQLRMPIHLEVRSAPQIGANAFALPGGTIVVTDELVDLITGRGSKELSGALAEELASVLAHEIGHVEKNHGMRRLVRDAMVTVIAGSLFSDFSSVASLASAGLVNMEFSREMETEADDYAIDSLKQADISPSRLADVLEHMEKSVRKHGEESSRKHFSQYLSSHPATEDRAARFRAAAKK